MHRFHPRKKKIENITMATNEDEITKNRIEGDAARAFRNISRTARSDSPRYLFNSWEDENENENASIFQELHTNLWTLHGYKIDPTFAGTRSDEDGLATPRWTIQQNAL